MIKDSITDEQLAGVIDDAESNCAALVKFEADAEVCLKAARLAGELRYRALVELRDRREADAMSWEIRIALEGSAITSGERGWQRDQGETVIEWVRRMLTEESQ